MEILVVLSPENKININDCYNSNNNNNNNNNKQ